MTKAIVVTEVEAKEFMIALHKATDATRNLVMVSTRVLGKLQIEVDSMLSDFKNTVNRERQARYKAREKAAAMTGKNK